MDSKSLSPSGIAVPVTPIEWKRVIAFASSVANNTGSNKLLRAAAVKTKLLRELRRLKRCHPHDYRIDATMADYVKTNIKRIELLRYAYKKAVRFKDRLNMAIIAVDLAEAYCHQRKFHLVNSWVCRAEKVQIIVQDDYVSLQLTHIKSQIRL